AQQREAIAQQKEYNEKMLNKVNQIIETNEERNQYLGMIESNTAANAYFAAANYLKR
ncbi:hypothetical protein JQM82_09865, partial [Faecalicatena contorta]|nr:hypothetical protein [Faecalicatena contorta]